MPHLSLTDGLMASDSLADEDKRGLQAYVTTHRLDGLFDHLLLQLIKARAVYPPQHVFESLMNVLGDDLRDENADSEHLWAHSPLPAFPAMAISLACCIDR